MIKQAKNWLRSWMLIYAGLIAAFTLAGDPAGTPGASATELVSPATVDASRPLLRQDI